MSFPHAAFDRGEIYWLVNYQANIGERRNSCPEQELDLETDLVKVEL